MSNEVHNFHSLGVNYSKVASSLLKNLCSTSIHGLRRLSGMGTIKIALALFANASCSFNLDLIAGIAQNGERDN